MSARDVIEHALRAYYVDSAEPNAIARDLLAQYDAERGKEKATATPAATTTPELLPTADVVAWLTKKAREERARGPYFVREADAIATLASKAARGAIRPDNLRTLPEEEPALKSSREQRLEQLLDTIRTHGGRWTTSHVQDMRRRTGHCPQRGTARRDLAELARRGHLVEHGPVDGRFYTLATREDRRA